MGVPLYIIHLNGFFPHKPSILGIPMTSWNPPLVILAGAKPRCWTSKSLRSTAARLSRPNPQGVAVRFLKENWLDSPAFTVHLLQNEMLCFIFDCCVLETFCVESMFKYISNDIFPEPNHRRKRDNANLRRSDSSHSHYTGEKNHL